MIQLEYSNGSWVDNLIDVKMYSFYVVSEVSTTAAETSASVQQVASNEQSYRPPKAKIVRSDSVMSQPMTTAVLLAGGLGTRLRPYTVTLPKPLMPIGEWPILEVIIRQLAMRGIRRLILAVNHQAELLRAYFGNGDRLGVEITYSLETKPLGTMGPLHLISSLPDNFFVMNGDVLCDLDFAALYDRHVCESRLFTIAAAKREMTIDYGVLEADPSGALTGFKEKPKTRYLVSTGIYCVSRRVLEWIPPNQPFGFDQLMLNLIDKGKTVHVDPHDGYW